MNSKTEKTTIDSTLIRQWFSSQPYLPMVRHYTLPLVEDLSLTHAALQPEIRFLEEIGFL